MFGLVVESRQAHNIHCTSTWNEWTLRHDHTTATF